ncbi:MAG: 4-alpha-glucanotransferase [Acidimicrobiia bacterium]|nr:4-alpha-glucanotransferase [Acidimicrobiia bacterium]
MARPVDAAAWGVQQEFVDAFGRRRRAPAATVDAVLDAMGATTGAPPPSAGDKPVRGAARCPRPPARGWGWAAQLYAARSLRSWGIGDLMDLDRLARWAAASGARFVLINPLHAAAPVLPQDPSPYNPSTRRFRSVLYLAVERVPGATDVDIRETASLARALNADRLIDRDEVLRLKLDALGRVWDGFRGDRRFDAYVEEQGSALDKWATFCVLAETYGDDWRTWPAPYQRPGTPEAVRVWMGHHDRIRFHQWLQWLLDVQLREASSHVDVMHDLAVGFAPGGFDAWSWHDLLAPGVSIGAPPDEFNTQGQVWGLPPFDPWKLRAAGYRPFVETIRASLRHAGALRIDHALGLARLYWVPDGVDPTDGVYVRYPFGELLDVIATESEAADAYVVAEDLGTSSPEIIDGLAARGLLSYRLLWFEQRAPEEYPELAMAAVTTHDLPTVAGLWSGRDLEVQEALGLRPNADGWRAVRARLGALADTGSGLDLGLDELDGPDPDADVADVIVGVHRALAGAPSLLVSGTLDDAIAVVERPNMPGTTTEWPNWRLALPLPLEEIESHPLAHRVAAALQRDRAG